MSMVKHTPHAQYIGSQRINNHKTFKLLTGKHNKINLTLQSQSLQFLIQNSHHLLKGVSSAMNIVNIKKYIIKTIAWRKWSFPNTKSTNFQLHNFANSLNQVIEFKNICYGQLLLPPSDRRSMHKQHNLAINIKWVPGGEPWHCRRKNKKIYGSKLSQRA